MTVGQKIWYVPTAYYRTDDRTPREATVSKVGRKYFEVQELPRARFDLGTLKQDSDSNYRVQCYRTLQEILDEREVETLTSKMRQEFGSYYYRKLSLQQLRAIDAIITEKP